MFLIISYGHALHSRSPSFTQDVLAYIIMCGPMRSNKVLFFLSKTFSCFFHFFIARAHKLRLDTRTRRWTSFFFERCGDQVHLFPVTSMHQLISTLNHDVTRRTRYISYKCMQRSQTLNDVLASRGSVKNSFEIHSHSLTIETQTFLSVCSSSC